MHQTRLFFLLSIDSGSGYLCQMEPVAHFGLGSKYPNSMTIEVRWPDGVTGSFDVSNRINQQFIANYPSVRASVRSYTNY